MTATPGITITGQSKEEVLLEIERLRIWASGRNCDVNVYAGSESTYDKLDHLEEVVKEDRIENYILVNMLNKKKVIKYDGNSNIQYVDHPDLYGIDGEKKKGKIRKGTPGYTKPKNRKKNKKTHKKK